MPADVKMKGWSGSEFNYKKVPFILLDAPESTEENPVRVPFTHGQAVSKTVTPDFSGGDMSVLIPEGELVNQLTITRPADLIPENIPEGKYIAGVGPGTFAGGGGDSGGNALVEYINSEATEIGTAAYCGMNNLRSVHFAKVTTMGPRAFANCAELEKADFDIVTSISGFVFMSCSKLVAVIFRSKSVVAFNGFAPFVDTPILDGGGYIYVPTAFQESYTAQYSSYHFRAIEDYPDICG